MDYFGHKSFDKRNHGDGIFLVEAVDKQSEQLCDRLWVGYHGWWQCGEIGWVCKGVDIVQGSGRMEINALTVWAGTTFLSYLINLMTWS